MITLIEKGVAAFLQTLIDAASLTAPAVATSSVTKSIAPQDRTVVVVMVHDMPDDSGKGLLYRAMLRITVESPADVPAVTPATHAAVEALVTTAFTAAHQSALDTAVRSAAPGFKAGSFFASGWQPARQDTEWQPHFDVILAITPSA